jgi:DNA-binding transcriptional LysR family regulator
MSSTAHCKWCGTPPARRQADARYDWRTPLDAIDHAGSFAAGAEQLLRVPSAVLYTIHKLEQDLGVTIFDRSGYRAKLTNAGEQLLQDGRELLRRAEEIEGKVKQVDAVSRRFVRTR